MIELKFDACRLFRDELERGPLERNDPHLPSYTLSMQDAEETCRHTFWASYVDNLHFMEGENLEELLKRMLEHVENSSDFTLVVQLGVSGSKSVVTLSTLTRTP